MSATDARLVGFLNRQDQRSELDSYFDITKCPDQSARRISTDGFPSTGHVPLKLVASCAIS